MFTTDGIEMTSERKMLDILQKHGLEARDFDDIFTRDTSLFEFKTIREMFALGLEPTEDLLQKLACGELDICNLKSYTASREDRQDSEIENHER